MENLKKEIATLKDYNEALKRDLQESKELADRQKVLLLTQDKVKKCKEIEEDPNARRPVSSKSKVKGMKYVHQKKVYELEEKIPNQDMELLDVKRNKAGKSTIEEKDDDKDWGDNLKSRYEHLNNQDLKEKNEDANSKLLNVPTQLNKEKMKSERMRIELEKSKGVLEKEIATRQDNNKALNRQLQESKELVDRQKALLVTQDTVKKSKEIEEDFNARMEALVLDRDGLKGQLKEIRDKYDYLMTIFNEHKKLIDELEDQIMKKDFEQEQMIKNKKVLEKEISTLKDNNAALNRQILKFKELADNISVRSFDDTNVDGSTQFTIENHKDLKSFLEDMKSNDMTTTRSNWDKYAKSTAECFISFITEISKKLKIIDLEKIILDCTMTSLSIVCDLTDSNTGFVKVIIDHPTIMTSLNTMFTTLMETIEPWSIEEQFIENILFIFWNISKSGLPFRFKEPSQIEQCFKHPRLNKQIKIAAALCLSCCDDTSFDMLSEVKTFLDDVQSGDRCGFSEAEISIGQSKINSKVTK